MDRRAFLLLLAGSPVFAASFEEFKAQSEQFKQQNKDEFEAYQQELLSEFKEYQRIIREEFLTYKQSITRVWELPALSNNHRWVQYSFDMKTRSIVDFQGNSLKIESAGGSTESRNSAIRHHLSHILMQDTKSAVENDALIAGIEKRLDGFKHVIKGNIPSGDSILGLAFSDEVSASTMGHSALVEQVNETYQFFPAEQQVTSRMEESLLAQADKGMGNPQSGGQLSEHVTIKLPSAFLRRRAKKQQPVVEVNAEKYKINFSAVMSLMHTESSFNPMALSESAYGLLMINPETSGKQAHEKIYGNEKIISPTFLYNNVNNIELGSAYFNLLYYKYLAGIDDPVSRLYCAIVSYNAGLASVARTFSGRPVLKKSFTIINQKSPDAVLKTFQDKLPFEESKIYLTKVKERLAYYIQ